jgi:DNA-binding MarR family transcriptional regulator
LLDQQLCFAMYRASRALIRAYGPLLEPLGLTYPQYLALLALWEEDALSVKRLGERLSLDSATLTPLLKRLERQGLVERRRDQVDQRIVRVCLSKKGQALRARARGVPNALAGRVADANDRSALLRLSKLREELQTLASRLEQSA